MGVKFYSYFTRFFSGLSLLFLFIFTLHDAIAQQDGGYYKKVGKISFLKESKLRIGEQTVLKFESNPNHQLSVSTREKSIGFVWQYSTDYGKSWEKIIREDGAWSMLYSLENNKNQILTYPVYSKTQYRVKHWEYGKKDTFVTPEIEITPIQEPDSRKPGIDYSSEIYQGKKKVQSKSKSDNAEVMTRGACPPCQGGSITSSASPTAICQGGNTQLTSLARIPIRIVEDFTGNVNPAFWFYQNGTINSNCTPSPAGGGTLWFDGPSNVVRQAETLPMNTSIGCNISFYLKHGGANTPTCEPADLSGENILLEYSPDGSNWFTIDTYDFNAGFENWAQECVTLPPAAKTPTTRFRFRQPDNSGVGFDNWALDKVEIDVEVDQSLINYSWTGGPVNSPFSQNTSASPTTTTTYTVTASYGNVTMTSSVTVTVSSPPTGGIVQGSSTACAGSCTHSLTLSGQIGTVAYWEESPGCNGSWTNIPNLTSTLTPCVNGTTCYRAAITTPGCPAAYSSVATLTVESIGTVNANQHICRGDAISPFTLTGTNCAVRGWETSISSNCKTTPHQAQWTSVANFTNTFTPVGLADTACIRAIVSCNGCPDARTNSASIDIDEPPSFDPITSDYTLLCKGFIGPVIKLEHWVKTITRWEVSDGCTMNNWRTFDVTGDNEVPTPSYNVVGPNCFRAFVKNGLCPEVPTPPFRIEVIDCPGQEPLPELLRDTLVCYNGTATFHIANLGGWRILRWERSTDMVTWNRVGNHVDPTLTVPNITSQVCYRVLVSNFSPAGLAQRYTNVACANAGTPIVSGTLTGADIKCEGLNSGCLELVGHTPPPNAVILRWETRRWDPLIPGWENNGDYTQVNFQGTEICYTNLTRATEYRVVLRDAAGCTTAVSTTALVDLDPATIPGSINGTTICINTNTNLTLTGHTGMPQYWERSVNCTGVYTAIIGSEFQTTINTGNLPQKVCYRVFVQSGVCPGLYTPEDTVDVTPIPNRGDLQENRTICRGSDSGILTLIGHNGPIDHWEKAYNIQGPWTQIANTFATFSENNMQQSTYYRVFVGSGACQIISDTVGIVVDPPSIAGVISPMGAVCSGIEATLQLTESTGNPVYWEAQPGCTGNFTTINHTLTTLSYTLTTTTCFRVLVKSGVCPGELTEITTITVVQPSSLDTLTGGNATICGGQQGGTLTLTGNIVGDIIRWEKSTSCPGFSNPTTIVNITTTHTIGILATTTCFRAVVQNQGCPVANSNPVTITVSPATVGGTVTPAQTICSGNAPNVLTLAGHTGNIIRWESSTSCGNFNSPTTISNTQTTYTPPILTTTTCYRAVVQSGNCTPLNSSSATITVTSAPIPGTVSADATLCGNQPNPNLQLQGHSGGNVLRWEMSTDCPGFATKININNVNTAYQHPSQLTTATCFRAVLRSPNGCLAYSTPATISISQPSVAGNLSAPQTVCNGQEISILTITGNQGNPVRWESSVACNNVWTSIANTAITYSPGVGTATTCFRAVVSNNGCPSVNTNIVQITVTQNVSPGAVAGGNSICSGGNGAQLTLSGNIGNVIRWESSTDCPAFVNNITTIANITSLYSPGIVTTTTCYRAVIQSGQCGLVNSTPTTISVDQPTLGGTVSQSDTVCNDTDPVVIFTLNNSRGTVQKWQYSTDCPGFSNPTDVNNTTVSLTTPPLVVTTCYRAIVKNGLCQPETSAVATLTKVPVSDAGTLNSSVTICAGNNTNLTLVGSVGQIVRWESSADCPNFSVPISIVNTLNTYNTGNLNDTICYRAVVKSGVCPEEFSNVVTVTVDEATLTGNVTADQTFCLGNVSGNLTLSNYSGTIVRWESSTSCQSFSSPQNIVNTTTTHNFSGLTTTTCFRAIIKSGSCPEAPSTAAKILIIQPSDPGIITGIDTICTGSQAGTLTLGTHLGDVLRWESSTDCQNFTNPTTTTTSLTTLAAGILTQTTCFRAVVQNGICPSANTPNFRINVDQLPIGGTIDDRQICINTQTQLTLKNYNGTIENWEFSLDCQNFTNPNIINQSTETINTQIINQTTCYRAKVRNGVCAGVYSQIGKVTVDELSMGGVIEPAQTICVTSTPGLLTLSGYNSIVSEWVSSTDCQNFTNPQVYNIHTETFQPPNLTQTTCFKARVFNGVCPQTESAVVKITVNEVSIGGTLVGSSTICSGANGQTLVLSGHRSQIVKWESSTDCINFTNPTSIANHQTQLTPINITETTCFRVVVKNGVCDTVVSDTAKVTVDPSTSAGIVKSAQNICYNTAPLPLVLENFTGIIESWQSSTQCAPFGTPVTIPNTTPNFSPPVLTQTTCYRAIVRSGNCPPAPSAAAIITVAPQGVGGTVTQNQTVCVNGTPVLLQLQNNVGNVIRWEQSTTCSPFSNPVSITNTNTTYQPDPIATTTCFRAVVQSGVGCPEKYSAEAVVSTELPSIGGDIGTDKTVCANNSGIQLTVTGQRGQIVRWESSFDCQNFNPAENLGGAGQTTITTPPVTMSKCFRAVVQNGVCISEYSSKILVTVDPLTTPGTLSSDQTICTGTEPTTLTLLGKNGDIIGWESSTNVNFSPSVPISNTATTLSIGILTETTRYRVIVKNKSCPSETSNVVVITVDNISVPGTIAPERTVCAESNTTTLTVSNFQGTIQRWQSTTDCVNKSNPQDISNTNATYIADNLPQTTCYRAFVKQGSCDESPTPWVQLTVTPTTIASSVSGSKTVCFSENATLTLNPGFLTDILRWESASDTLFTIGVQTIVNTSSTLTVTNNTVTRYYRAVVKNGICPSKNSIPAKITVLPSPDPGAVQSDQTICISSTPSNLTLVGNQNGNILRWESSTGNFSNPPFLTITNTTTTLAPGLLTTTTCFRAVLASGGNCPEVMSTPACIKVDPQTIPGILASDKTVCSSSSTVEITLSGSVGSVQNWEKSLNSDMSGSVVIPNSSGTFLQTFINLTQTTYVRASVKSGVCDEQKSNTVKITVDEDPAIPSAGADQTICTNTAVLNGSEPIPSVAIGTWTTSTPGVVIANSNLRNTNVSNLAYGANVFTWTVRNGNVCSAKSATVTINRDHEPTISNAGNNETICETQTSYTLKANNGNIPDFGTGVWTKTGIGTGNISDPNSPTTIATGLSLGANEFTYTISNGVCTSSLSKVVITVDSKTVPGIIRGDSTVCYGNNTGRIVLSGNNGMVVRWESTTYPNFNGVVSSINNMTNTLTYSNLTQTTRFRALLKNGVCAQETTNVVIITVDPATIGGNIDSDRTVCRDGNSGVLILSGNTGNVLRWETSLSASFSPITILSNVTSLQSYTNLTQTTYYRAISKSGVCNELPSDAVEIKVVKPIIGMTVNHVKCFGGNDASINPNVTDGQPFNLGEPYRYSWTKNGATFSNNLNISNLSVGNYCLQVTDAIGCITTSCVTITQPEKIVAKFKGLTHSTCNGLDNGTINIEVSGGVETSPYSFRWTKNNIDFAVTQNLSNLTPGSYSVTVTDINGCQDMIGPFIITQPTALVAALSYINHVTCANAQNGAIGHNISGGVPPYNYLWSTGKTTEDIENLTGGAYTVTITDQTGCILVVTYIVREPGILVINPTIIKNPLCYGDHTGSIGVDVMGGTQPYKYQWSNGYQGEDLMNVPAGTYELVVRDNKNCLVRKTFILGSNEKLSGTINEVSPIKCFGQSTGKLKVIPSGGTPPYKYLWSNGSTTDSSEALSAGGHNVTIIDANLCTVTLGYELNQPDGLITILEKVLNVSCKGGNDGSIAYSVRGGIPLYKYIWSNGVVTQDLKELSPGVYTVTISDANNCKLVKTWIVSEPENPLRIEVLKINKISCRNALNGMIDIDVQGGTPPYNYSWSNGETTQDLNGVGGGSYTLMVRDSKQCLKSITLDLGMPDELVAKVNFIHNPTCYNAKDGSIGYHISGGVQPYTYIWNNGIKKEDIRNLSAGTYTLTATDANACSIVVTQILTAPTPVSIKLVKATNPTCNNANGSIISSVTGGTPPYIFSWSNGITNKDLTDISSGVYILRVTDQNGCFETMTVTLSQPPGISVNLITKKNVSCFDSQDGSILVNATGGVSPLKFTWKKGNQILNNSLMLSNVGAGIYNLEVIDAIGCKKVYIDSITQPKQLKVILLSTDPICFNEISGKITAQIEGGTAPYTYIWSNKSSGKEIKNLPSGTYILTVTDSKGCKVVTDATVVQPKELSIVISKNNVNCKGSKSGIIRAKVTGGMSPYTYSWSNGANTAENSGLLQGVYSLTVTDAKGCEKIIKNILIIEPEKELKVTLSYKNDVRCASDPNGAIGIDVTGGIEPYQYSWSNGMAVEDINRLSGGTYTVTIRDAGGCIVTFSQFIDSPTSALNVTIDFIKHIICHGDAGGSIGIDVSGGTQPYRYQWSNGSGVEDQINLKSGNYNVMIFDAKGCMVTKGFAISEPTPIQVEVINSKLSGCGITSVVLGVTGGVEPYTFNWSNGETIRDATSLIPGNHMVKITDAIGCVKNEIIVVEGVPELEATWELISPITCEGMNNAAIDLTVNGGFFPYTYLWSTGSTKEDIFGLGIGPISVTVKDKMGCTITLSQTLSAPKGILLTGTVFPVRCHGGSNGSVIISTSGGIPPYTYKWSTGAITKDITGLKAGKYSITVVDSKGCTTNKDFEISQPFQLKLEQVLNVMPSCSNGKDGILTIEATGGTLPYSYAWSNSSNRSTLNGVAAGNYIVTVTDAKGCKIINNFTIKNPDPILISEKLIIPANCNGGTNGLIDIDVKGGDPPYIYSWTTSAPTQDISNLKVGEYTVIITDSKGCQAERTFIVPSKNNIPVQITGLPSQTCVSGAIIPLSGNPGGGTFSGNGVSGKLFNPAGAGTGDHVITYSVSSGGCISKATKVIKVVDIPSLSEIKIGNLPNNKLKFCKSEINPYLLLPTVLEQGVTSMFYGPGVIRQGNVFKFVPANAGAGTFTLRMTLTNSAGCTRVVTKEVIVETPNPISVSASNLTVCIGNSTVLTATGADEFVWNPNTGFLNVTPNSVEVYPSKTTTYTATSVSGGCQISKTIRIEVIDTKPIEVIQYPNIPVCSGEEVTIKLSSPTNYEYTWEPFELNSQANDGQILVHPNQTTTYTITGATPDGCIKTTNVMVIVQESTFKPTSNYIEICSGGSTQLQIESLTGGTYRWAPATGLSSSEGMVVTASPIQTTVYTITRLDQSGICNTQTVKVVVKPGIQAGIGGIDNRYCLSSGSVSFSGTPVGGVFTGNGIIGNVFNPQLAGLGTHLILYTGVDKETGCQYKAEKSISVNLNSEAKFLALPESLCVIAEPINLIAVPIGGRFEGLGVINGKFYPQIAGIGLHSIRYTGTEPNGCTYDITRDVLVQGTEVVLEIPSKICISQMPIVMQATPSGGSYSGKGVSGNIFNPSIAGLGTHTITYSGIDGLCTYSKTVVISVVNDLSATPVVIPTTCANCNDGKITVNVSGGSGNYLYILNNHQPVPGNVFSNLGNGTYQILVSDDAGCSVLTNATISTLVQNGCLSPGGIFISNITAKTASVSWSLVPGATRYYIYWRKKGTQDPYRNISTVQLNFLISNLLPNTEYEVKIRTRCDNVFSPMSDEMFFKTQSGREDSLIDSNISFEVYPNPNTGQFYLSTSERLESNEILLEVIDSKGAIIWEETVTKENNEDKFEINIPGLSSGVYLMKIKNGNKENFAKIVIE